MTNEKPYTYKKERIAGRVLHKYVIHNLRHGTQTGRLIETAKAWALENIQPGDWFVHIVDADSSALFWIAKDTDAMLFELSLMLHPADKRGRKVWG